MANQSFHATCFPTACYFCHKNKPQPCTNFCTDCHTFLTNPEHVCKTCNKSFTVDVNDFRQRTHKFCNRCFRAPIESARERLRLQNIRHDKNLAEKARLARIGFTLF